MGQLTNAPLPTSGLHTPAATLKIVNVKAVYQLVACAGEFSPRTLLLLPLGLATRHPFFLPA
jgi:hypothetical protein